MNKPKKSVSTILKYIYYWIALGITGYGLWLVFEQGIKWLPIVYAVAMVLVYGLYAKDKHAAKIGLWRTPESTLHLLELLGGWVSAFWAQERLRHKTKKLGYQITFWIIVTLHLAFWADFVFFNLQGIQTILQFIDSDILNQLGLHTLQQNNSDEIKGYIEWSR